MLDMSVLHASSSSDDVGVVPSWLHFPVHVLELEFEMLQPFKLPAFAGSLFRGVLGWSLKEVCDKAAYSYLFETASDRSGLKDAPRPFILIPPLGSRRLNRGDRFSLILKLLGRGCDYLPDLVEALLCAGERGLGRERARFSLRKIVSAEGDRKWVCFHSQLGWDRSYQPLPSPLGIFTFLDAAEHCSELTLQFQTPTRLVHLGEPAAQPELHIVMRALLRRLDTLLAFHGGTVTFEYPRRLLEIAQDTPGEYDVEWVDWDRTSNRQKRRHRMGGIVGGARYRGDFSPEWITLLRAGEVLHLGKSTTFGMGCYQLVSAV